MNPELAEALATAQRDRINLIMSKAERAALKAWEQLGDYTSPGALDRWLAMWGPINEGAVQAAVATTDGYMALAAEAAPLGGEATSGALLRGVDPEVYARRPLVDVWSGLKRGTDWADAVKVGAERVSGLVTTDVSLAQRATADKWVEVGGIVGYRRTLTGVSCVLCAMASTQRYNSDNLMPIHRKCDCGVAAITGTEDPGQVINSQLLRDLKTSGAAGDLSLQQGATRMKQRAAKNRAEAERVRVEASTEDDPKRKRRLERRAKNYDQRAAAQKAKAAEYTAARTGKGARYAVHEHGELGAVITREGVAFTREADLN